MSWFINIIVVCFLPLVVGNNISTHKLVENGEGEDFYFTVASHSLIKPNSTFPVAITLEKSKVPVNVTLVILKEKDGTGVLAHEEVIVKPNEQVVIQMNVKEIPVVEPTLVVTATTGNGKLLVKKVKEISLERDWKNSVVIVQTDKKTYGPNDKLKYRLVIVDRSLRPLRGSNYYLRISVENSWSPRPLASLMLSLPESGIYQGSFPYMQNMRQISAFVTSGSDPLASVVAEGKATFTTSSEGPQSLLNVEISVLSTNVYYTRPVFKSVIKFTSQGFSNLGKCQAYLTNTSHYGEVLNKKSVSLDELSGTGTVEFNVLEDLEVKMSDVKYEGEDFILNAECVDLMSGKTVSNSLWLKLYKSPYTVELMHNGPSVFVKRSPDSSNSSIVVVKIRVGSRNKSPFANGNPESGLQVALQLSNETLRQLQPSQTNFTLTIPEDGIVTLEFKVQENPDFTLDDKIYMAYRNASRAVDLLISNQYRSPRLYISLVNPTQDPIRQGDTLRVQVCSFRPYSSLNSLLVSHKGVISSHRYSFSPSEPEAGLGEVIQVKVPRNSAPRVRLLLYGFIQMDKSYEEKAYVTSGALEFDVMPADNPTSDLQLSVENVQNSAYINVTATVNSPLQNYGPSVSIRESHVAREGLKSSEFVECKYLPFKDDKNFESNQFEPLDLEHGIDITSNAKVHKDTFSYRDHFPRELFGLTHSHLQFRDGVGSVNYWDTTNTTKSKLISQQGSPGRITFDVIVSNRDKPLAFTSSNVTVDIPPSISIRIRAPYAIYRGETVNIGILIENPMDTLEELNLTLKYSTDGLNETRISKLIKVNPESSNTVSFPVRSETVGSLLLTVSSDLYNNFEAEKMVKVRPPGTQRVLINSILVEGTDGLEDVELEIKTSQDCRLINNTFNITKYPGDVLGDVVSNFPHLLSGIPDDGYPKIVWRFINRVALLNYLKAKGNTQAVERILPDLAKEHGSIMFSQRNDQQQGSFWSTVNQDIGAKYSVPIIPALIDGLELIKTEKESIEKGLSYLGKKQTEEGGFKWSWDESGVEQYYAESALTLLTFHKAIKAGYNSSLTLERFNKGVDFLRENASKINDNYPLCVAACLFTEIGDSDASSFIEMLEKRASRNENGSVTHWKSSLNRTKFPVAQNPSTYSVDATAHALMAYMNMNRTAGAKDIARWLVSQKNEFGGYSSYEDTSVGITSLVKFTKYSEMNGNGGVSLVKATQSCFTTFVNSSTGSDFNLTAVYSENMGKLTVEVCPVRDDPRVHLYSLDMALPSGFFFDEQELKSRCTGNLGTSFCSFVLEEGGSKLLFRNSNSFYLLKCDSFYGYRMLNVSNPNESGEVKPLVGLAMFYDYYYPVRKSIKYFT